MEKKFGDKINFEKINPKNWLTDIIVKANSMGASDIHIDPGRDVTSIRFRIDGILQDIYSFPIDYLNQIIFSLKVMAELDITETRRPQDGHIIFRPESPKFIPESIDLRLSIFPTIFGQAAVLRILNRKDLLFEGLDKLGIEPEDAEKLQSILHRFVGMVLVTGPGGSGKTTTLYTILNSLRSPQRNIITLEDPVELCLGGIRQSQIHPEVNFNFSDGLRSILRQDPDVVMVGEIRDNETAEISVRAALTGVLFLSTMHTTNSVGAIVRFLELGIPRSLIASALKVVITQRLVRKICPVCKMKVEPPKKFFEIYGTLKKDELNFYEGKGCNNCFKTGYLGRSGVFEILFINKKIQQLIIEGAPFTEIEAQAKKDGLETLQEVAIKEALGGVTTIEEAMRVAPFSS